MTPTFHRLTIQDIRRETRDTVSVAFSVPEDLKAAYSYSSGQYLTLKLELDGEEIRRSYSLCSAPYQGEWRVAIKEVENGKFSTYANKHFKVGQEIDVMTPTGSFTTAVPASGMEAAPERKKSYILFAAGSGITPVISLAKDILHTEPESLVTLFYGNKNFGSIIFREELEALKNEHINRFRIIHILSRENLGNPIQKGRIDAEKCEKLAKAFLTYEKTHVDEVRVFVCGPEEMILAVKESMTSFGVPSKQIHFELFGVTNKKPVEKVEGPVVKANVRIILDGDAYDLSLKSDSENVLDAAHRIGADLPFACKGGVCCTCKAKILEGTARMEVNYGLEQEEIDAGYILTCQAHPTSEKLVLSFDD